MKKVLLPIGSVVLLKEATKRIMITGFCVKSDEDNELFDYAGCLYPEGLISSRENLLFNNDQIGKVFFVGYSDEEEKHFKQALYDKIGENFTDNTDNN